MMEQTPLLLIEVRDTGEPPCVGGYKFMKYLVFDSVGEDFSVLDTPQMPFDAIEVNVWVAPSGPLVDPRSINKTPPRTTTRDDIHAPPERGDCWDLPEYVYKSPKGRRNQFAKMGPRSASVVSGTILRITEAVSA
jgi:hypothetical protein